MSMLGRIARHRYNPITRLVAKAYPVRKPIFILGCARSGTGIFMELFSRHPDVCNYSEANYIWDRWGYPWVTSPGARPPVWIDPETYAADWWEHARHEIAGIKGVFSLRLLLSGKSQFVNKSPLNSYRIPYILQMYPDARFVHIVRDGRAVALSYTKKMRAKMRDSSRYSEYGYAMAFDDLVIHLAEFWRETIRIVENALSPVDKSRKCVVVYEEFCADPREIIAGIDAKYMQGMSPRDLELIPEKLENRNYKWREQLSPQVLERLESSGVGFSPREVIGQCR